ncbi:MAG TPA: hypothetical protein PKA49_09375 [Tepidiformaceae bacterium]|nr:hypothetical protein [Tepidiformaceae bacterium]
MKAREFLFGVEERAMAALPPAFPRPERKVMWTILQLHFGDPDVHFELQPQPSRGIVELGLHFEGTPEANDLWAAYIASRAGDLIGPLGHDWELEAWTASWRRLHRTFAFEQLTADLADDVARELAAALMLLQPIIAAAPFEAPRRQAAPPRDHTSRRWNARKPRA